MQEVTITIRTPIDIDEPFKCECKGYEKGTDTQICQAQADVMVLDSTEDGIIDEDAHWHAFHEHVVSEWYAKGETNVYR